MTKNETAAGRWQNLEGFRSIYLRRAIDCSSLTIPSLIPESDQNWGYSAEPQAKLKSLYQGAGARGVNGLSAQLLLALYPPATPFFRLVIERGKIEQALAETGNQEEDIISQLDVALSGMERQILQKLDALQARPALFEAVKHLIVGGNALLYLGEDQIKMYSLRSYCVDRDPEGNVSEIVLRELVNRQYVPVKEFSKKDQDGDKPIEVYTWVEIDKSQDRVEWHQEYDGKTIPGSQGFSQVETSPWLCLRLLRIAGESYGRSVVEEALGDLQSLESLSQAIVEGSLIAAKAVALVNPNGMTRVDTIARAENGACVSGSAADVDFLQVGKQADNATALQTMQLIERRLNFTFLNSEAATRDAERVSAAEIRLMANSLERGLGGIYSILSHELQLPIIKRVMHLMSKSGELMNLPKGLVNPQITTGLESIGRNDDSERLTTFVQTLGATLGPEALQQYVNPVELIRRYAAANGIDINGLVRSEDELNAEQAQQQQLMLSQQLAQGAINNGATSPIPQEAPQAAGGPTPVGAGPGSPAQIPVG